MRFWKKSVKRSVKRLTKRLAKRSVKRSAKKVMKKIIMKKRRTGGFISKEMREMMMPARGFHHMLPAFCLAFVYGMTKDTIELRNHRRQKSRDTGDERG